MIRRGLQVVFLCGITFLGVAPVYGTAYDYYPESMTVTGFPVQTDGFNVNGFYIRTTFTTSGSVEFLNFAADGTTCKLQMVYAFGGITFYLGPNVNSASGRLYTKNLASLGNNPLPATISGWSSQNGALAAVNGYATGHGSSDQYAANFPDWESAGVKIPLGFTFGMSVWAAFLAGTIALKWVRELSSAAT